MMARWRGRGAALSPIRSFVTSNRQFTMREFFQFIHSAVTAVFYLRSTSQQPPHDAPPSLLSPHPNSARPRLLSGDVGLQEVNRGRVLILLFDSCLSQPREGGGGENTCAAETTRKSDSPAFKRGSCERRGAFRVWGVRGRVLVGSSGPPRRKNWPCNEGRRVEQGKRQQMKKLGGISFQRSSKMERRDKTGGCMSGRCTSLQKQT